MHHIKGHPNRAYYKRLEKFRSKLLKQNKKFNGNALTSINDCRKFEEAKIKTGETNVSE